MSFDKKKKHYAKSAVSLNPFRAGRFLSTESKGLNYSVGLSQSLSSRAMSFDNNFLKDLAEEELSQSLSSRAMSFDF